MPEPVRQYRITSRDSVMRICAEAATALQGEPTGDAVAAALMLAYLTVTDDASITEDTDKMRKLISDLSLYLTLWGIEGPTN